jgi:flagellar basal body-associated protein FliL
LRKSQILRPGRIKACAGTDRQSLVRQKPAQRPQPALFKSAAKYGDKDSKASTAKNSGRDNFTTYAAIIALVGFIIIFGTIVYTKQIKSDALTPSYLTLPQNVVTVDDQTIRMVITVQVASADGGWLANHKQALSDLFPIVMTTIDVNDLNTEEGMDRAREKLRTELNSRLQTDKIQAVLVDELLTRSLTPDVIWLRKRTGPHLSACNS